MQTIKLNLIPGSVLPVVNVSQYDVGRHFALQVYEGATAYDLTGKDVQIRGTKPDGNGFAYDSTDGAISVSTNTVTVTTLQQMTAVGGQTMCELRITSGSDILGTINFILMVEPSALSDDTPISDTDIPAIERLAEAQVEQAEAWARGTKGGVPVSPDEPQYHDNAYFWSQMAQQYAQGGLRFMGSVAFASIPTTGMTNGDMYNITDTFTTDSRFIKGAGISVAAGTNIAWIDSVSKWDLLSAGSGSSDYTQLTNKPQINNVTLSGNKSAMDLGLATDSAMTGATAGTAGAKGLVPAPAAGDEGKFLRGDGTWAEGGGGGTTIVQIPSVVVGTYTYTGSAQGPTITGLDAAHTVVTGDTATNVGDYTLTIALADPQTMVWSDLTTADKTYSWSIGKAPGAVTLSKNTVVLSNSVPSDTVTISNATGPISITSGDTSVATVSPSTMSASGGTLTVTGAGAGTATVTVSVAASSNYDATSSTISVTNSIANHIYGAVWDGSADTSWTRTDDAASFADPQPYYAGMSGTPSSPFDSIQPWAGMQKSSNGAAGALVAIPKFYYKLGYASGTTGLKVQIAPASNGAAWASDNGFSVSPAHMDRGDGSGERDVIYAGRYHCASDYMSKSGVVPKINTTRATFRSGIHALGTTIWQWDYATVITIRLLYLVEFASWNSQAKIGGGCTQSTSVMSAVYNMGSTDSMPYHTGTVSSSIGATVYGATQYRNIEGLWDNSWDFVDGIYFAKSNGDIYSIINPANFSDSSGGTNIGALPSSEGYQMSVSLPSTAGYEWAMFANATGGSSSTYICDNITCKENASTYGSVMFVGGKFSQDQGYGMFGTYCDHNESFAHNAAGSRLMVLPTA